MKKKRYLPDATKSVFGRAATAEIQFGSLLVAVIPWAVVTIHSGFFFIEPQRDNVLRKKFH